VSLRGSAQGVLGKHKGAKLNYHALMRALEERFATPSQRELYKMAPGNTNF
jgi:hypothetical protein